MDVMEEEERVKKKICKIVAYHMGVPVEEIDEDTVLYGFTENGLSRCPHARMEPLPNYITRIMMDIDEVYGTDLFSYSSSTWRTEFAYVRDLVDYVLGEILSIDRRESEDRAVSTAENQEIPF